MLIELLLLQVQTRPRTTPPPDALKPVALRCEYQQNPLGIGEERPRLSWQVTSPVRGEKQTAYRVLVASNPATLARDEGDLWDTKKVASDATTHLEYAGAPLKSRQKAYWKVIAWGRANLPPVESPVSTWEMGLRSPSDWSAQWIGQRETAVAPPNLSQARWIWTPEGNPAADAPPGKRWFRTTFEVPAGSVGSAQFGFAADDTYAVTLNGEPLISGRGWTSFGLVNAAPALKVGTNQLDVEANNDMSRAGLLAAGIVRMADGRSIEVFSGPKWESSIDRSAWQPAKDLAGYGGQPYGPTRWSSRSTQPAVYLRRSFSVKGPVKSARLYSTARGLYVAHLNGTKVSEDIFRPGWTDYRKRIQVQTYDVTKLLRPGPSALGITLGDGWFSGHIGLMGPGIYGTKPSALAQLEIEYADGSRETVATDGTWQVSSGPILDNDLLMGETYDARKELGNWTTPTFDAKAWTAAEATPRDETPLVNQVGPSVRKFSEIAPLTMKEPTKGSYVFDLGQNMVGWARLRVKGPAGTTVRLRFAEMLNPDGTIYTTNLRGAKCTDFYTLKGGGTEVYEPTFTFRGFRYVEVTGLSGSPTMDTVRGVVVTTDTPRTGTFVTSNALVNQLVSNIEWGQRGNYLEVPTDCPQRDERLGWMGDAQVFIRTAASNAQVADFMGKWMVDVEDAQSPNGSFVDFAPRAPGMTDGAPAWADAGIIVPWMTYRMYGDTRILARHYDAMKRFVDFVDRSNPNHLWLNGGGNNFGDWLNVDDDTPRPIIGTAYFANSVGLMTQIAEVLGKADDARRFTQLRRQIVDAYNRAYVGPDGTMSKETQTAYILGLRFNLLPENRRAFAAQRLSQLILEKSKGHLSTGFVGVGLLNPTLSSIGRDDIAYKLLLNETYPSWGYSIRQGATTIWERWDGWTQDKGFQDPGMNSFNHYSLGAVGEWLYSNVAGIDLDPTVPAFKQFRIKPTPGAGIDWVRASFDSIHGRIESAWRRTPTGFALDVRVPTNTTALVYVPATHVHDVREGRTIASFARGVVPISLQDGFAVYKVGGGTYRFRTTARP